jgi:hypothetical protein
MILNRESNPIFNKFTNWSSTFERFQELNTDVNEITPSSVRRSAQCRRPKETVACDWAEFSKTWSSESWKVTKLIGRRKPRPPVTCKERTEVGRKSGELSIYDFDKTGIRFAIAWRVNGYHRPMINSWVTTSRVVRMADRADNRFDRQHRPKSIVFSLILSGATYVLFCLFVLFLFAI